MPKTENGGWLLDDSDLEEDLEAIIKKALAESARRLR